MKARAQKGKEKDKYCVAELFIAMNNMDRSLMHEINQSIDGDKVMEKKAERILPPWKRSV